MIGLILATKYKVLRMIGSGGMGKVYSCLRIEIGDEVAIKVLSKNPESSELLNEARAAGVSNHPNICKVFDYFEENGQCFLVMEKLEGLDLSKIIEISNHLSERFTFRFIFGVIREIALALQHSHISVLHRDIKPANIFLTTQGEIKILDFGIAKFLKFKSDQETHPCTEAYSSPDLWIDGKYDSSKYEASHDIYSLGLIFYEMFNLKQASRNLKILSLSTEDYQAPEAIESFFCLWVSPRKSERFKNAEELISAIDLIYPEDFNVKQDVQQVVFKAIGHLNRNLTLKESIPVNIHKSTKIQSRDSWLVVATFTAIILTSLAMEYYFNYRVPINPHDKILSLLVKKDQSRGLASPE